MNFKLKYFEEAYTTENWIVRIYRVKDRGNLQDLDYVDEAQQQGTSMQALSWISTSADSNKYLKSKTPFKTNL